MARVQLVIDDVANRLTLKAILEAEGHRTVEVDPDVVVVDGATAAVEWAQQMPALTLAAAAEIRDAVAAMHKGVYGYIFVPFQPGEAGIMVQRAAQSRFHGSGAPETAAGQGPDWAPMTLEEAEVQHILTTLRHCKNNRARAARLLGIGRNTLWRKLKQTPTEK
jgi:DNA-binding NtrC family response regulator